MAKIKSRKRLPSVAKSLKLKYTLSSTQKKNFHNTNEGKYTRKKNHIKCFAFATITTVLGEQAHIIALTLQGRT